MHFLETVVNLTDHLVRFANSKYQKHWIRFYPLRTKHEFTPFILSTIWIDFKVKSADERSHYMNEFANLKSSKYFLNFLQKHFSYEKSEQTESCCKKQNMRLLYEIYFLVGFRVNERSFYKKMLAHIIAVIRVARAQIIRFISIIHQHF